jgi:hypothetical protein
MNAILTSSLEGAKLKKALLDTAEHVGHLCIENRDYWKGNVRLTPFYEITHYFDSDMHELGMIAFRDTPVETILMYDLPRVWAECFLAHSAIHQNRWNKRFNSVDGPRQS